MQEKRKLFMTTVVLLILIAASTAHSFPQREPSGGGGGSSTTPQFPVGVRATTYREATFQVTDVGIVYVRLDQRSTVEWRADKMGQSGPYENVEVLSAPPAEISYSSVYAADVTLLANENWTHDAVAHFRSIFELTGPTVTIGLSSHEAENEDTESPNPEDPLQATSATITTAERTVKLHREHTNPWQ